MVDSNDIFKHLYDLSKHNAPKWYKKFMTNSERIQSKFTASRLAQTLRTVPLYYMPTGMGSPELADFEEYMTNHADYLSTFSHYTKPWEEFAIVSTNAPDIIIVRDFVKTPEDKPTEVCVKITYIHLTFDKTAGKVGFVANVTLTYDATTVRSDISKMCHFGQQGMSPFEPTIHSHMRMGFSPEEVEKSVKEISALVVGTVSLALHVLLLSKPTIIPDYSKVENPKNPAYYGDKDQRRHEYRYITLKVDAESVRKLSSFKRTWKLKFRSKMPGGTMYFRHERYKYDENGNERPLQYDHKGRPYYVKSDYDPYERCKGFPEKPPLQEKYVAKEANK